MTESARRIGVGIDFGTSNSVAATYDGNRVSLVSLRRDDATASAPQDRTRRGSVQDDLPGMPAADAKRLFNAGEHAGEIMPSATYIDRSLQPRTGWEAVQRYIADNTGRKVELVPEVIGKAMLSVGSAGTGSRNPGDSLTADVYSAPMTDTGTQGRLFRGAKRLLGKQDVRRLMVFDHPFRLVALITPILLRMRKALARRQGEIAACGAGHPVNFEGRDRYRNQLALSRLGEAYRYAGIARPRFYPEPIAAAVSYLDANPSAAGERLLTVDFGGGTLDFCVLERVAGRRAASADVGKHRFRVVTTHGIALGGDHIDQRMFRELLFPLLGKGERWKRRGEYGEIDTLFPFEDYEDLLVNWAVTYLLNQNRYTEAVQRRIDQGGEARIKFRRLRELIQQNLGYLIFQAIKDCKARLSETDETTLDIPEIDVEVPVTRREFDGMIGDMLSRLDEAVARTLQRASLPEHAIDIVLRTGGSSLIPAVHRLLDDRFPGRVVDHDPFTSVAAGLAIAHYHNLSAD